MKVLRCLSQVSSDTFPYSSGESIWARFVARVRTCFKAARSVQIEDQTDGEWTFVRRRKSSSPKHRTRPQPAAGTGRCGTDCERRKAEWLMSPEVAEHSLFLRASGGRRYRRSAILDS